MFRTALLGLLAAVCVHAGNCNSINPPIEWTINQSYVDGTYNGIQGDGLPYVNGQSGVTAVINVCSGSGDATLQLSGKTRSIKSSFQKMLVTNKYTPSFALSRSAVNVDFMNVRNIYFVPQGTDRTQEYTFTTRFGSTLSDGTNAPILAPTVDAPPATGPNINMANAPYPNSPVIVHHCPANTNTSTCPNIVHETWFAYPDQSPTAPGLANGWPITQVGALLVSSKNTTANGGEFSMPFYFMISLLN